MWEYEDVTGIWVEIDSIHSTLLERQYLTLDDTRLFNVVRGSKCDCPHIDFKNMKIICGCPLTHYSAGTKSQKHNDYNIRRKVLLEDDSEK
jgi:hypothetical protein